MPDMPSEAKLHGIAADEPVHLPKFDVTWLAIGDAYKLMHVKVMSPAELGLGPDVQVSRWPSETPKSRSSLAQSTLYTP